MISISPIAGDADDGQVFAALAPLSWIRPSDRAIDRFLITFFLFGQTLHILFFFFRSLLLWPLMASRSPL